MENGDRSTWRCGSCEYFCPSRYQHINGGFCGQGWVALRIGSPEWFCGGFQRWDSGLSHENDDHPEREA